MDLPRVLMLLSLLATNDTVIVSTALHAALKTAKLSVKNDFQFLIDNFLWKIHPRVKLHTTWQVPGPGAAVPNAVTSLRLSSSSPLSIWTMTYLPDVS